MMVDAMRKTLMKMRCWCVGMQQDIGEPSQPHCGDTTDPSQNVYWVPVRLRSRAVELFGGCVEGPVSGPGGMRCLHVTVALIYM